MKTIILCGGKGTRMWEETEYRPKALVKVGDQPILWHIMKIYAHHGYQDFILALGYKGKMIEDYFSATRDFRISFVDTGLESLTGERIRRLKQHIDDDEFMVTYGDGVADIDINKLIDFHHRQGTVGTITGAQPYSKYGFLRFSPDNNLVSGFNQKPLMNNQYVSSGFMVFNKKFFDYLGEFPNGMIEDTFPKLIEEKQLSIYRHNGFWKAMDTLKEVQELNEVWQRGSPWKIWEA